MYDKISTFRLVHKMFRFVYLTLKFQLLSPDVRNKILSDILYLRKIKKPYLFLQKNVN